MRPFVRLRRIRTGLRRTVSPMPRRAKNPSLAQDLVTLGDIYLTLGWLALQRLRHGPLWPWDAELGEPTARLLTLVRPDEVDEESAETTASKRG